MRIGTLASLSVAGMLTASFTGWQVAASRAAHRIPVATREPPVLAPDAGPSAVSNFRVGDSLTMEGRLGHSVQRAEAQVESYVYAEVRAAAGKLARTPAPLNLAIVIDRSGSMRGKKLENAVAAARVAVARLRDGDAVSVISYNTATETISPVTTVDAAARERVGAAIGSMTAQGNTCISCALELASELLRQRSGMVNRILLLSDGEATAGVRTVEEFRNIATRCRDAGTSITTIGVDVEYNERVMAELAIESNGRHYFVENADGLPHIFDQEIESLTQTIASDAELVVTPAPGVTFAQAYDRTYRREGGRVVVPLGTFAAGEQKTLLVRLGIPASPPGVHPITEVELRYRDLAEGRAKDARGALSISLSPDPSRVSALDPLVELRRSRSEARSALFEANELFRAGRVDEARAIVNRQAAAVRKRKAGYVPLPGGAAIGEDYQRQAAALDEAETGFNQAPGQARPAPAAQAPGAVAKARSAPAQVRANADYATRAGF
jgi:Ca-activated chloride channel homolog